MQFFPILGQFVHILLSAVMVPSMLLPLIPYAHMHFSPILGRFVHIFSSTDNLQIS